MSEPTVPRRGTIVVIGLLIVLNYTITLGAAPLIEPDEPRYAEIAREMLESGDWVTPHLNYVKYFEKPPLVYWLTAATMGVLGSHEAVLRLWPALFGLMGLGCAWILGRSIYGPLEGLLAAAILACTPFYFGLSQVLILDMPLSALITIALTAGWLLYQQPSSATNQARGLSLILYAAVALGVLTKGPVAAVLVGATLLGFTLLSRDLGFLRRLLSVGGLVLFVVIAVPWFVLVSWRNPEFFDFFVIDQHVNRYLHPSEHRAPVWFYVPIVLAGMLPWTLILAGRLRWIGERARALVMLRVSPGTLYCAVWAAVVFLFFSFSGSKLATYILPVFCPLAVLSSRAVVGLWREQRVGPFRWLLALVAFLALGLFLAAAVLPFVLDRHRIGELVRYLWLGGFVMLAFALTLRGELRRQAPRPARLLGVAIAGTLAVQVSVMAGRSAAQHYKPLALAIREQAEADDSIVLYRHYTQGFPFYTARRVIMVGAWGELEFGRRLGDQSGYFWKEDEQLFQAWRSGRRMFLVVNASYLDRLRPQLDPAPREVARFGKKILLVNFPASSAHEH
jgi:4-amino-4-deoxy-L-arabinose transferase-like glycosyltransferase